MANLLAAAQTSSFSIICRCSLDQKSVNDLLSELSTAGTPGGGAGADAWNYANEISMFFGSVAAGSYGISVEYSDGAANAFAIGTVTFSGNLSNNDTLTIGGVLITFVTGTPSGSQVKIGATQAATMANLIAFINANGSANNLIGLCSASLTSANVITLSSDYPGLVGNLITVSKSAANLAVPATLTGGALVTQAPFISIGI